MGDTQTEEITGRLVYPQDPEEVFDTTEKLAELLERIEPGVVALLAHHMTVPELPTDRDYIECKIMPQGREMEPGETFLFLFALEEDEPLLRRMAEQVITKVLGSDFLGGGWMQ